MERTPEVQKLVEKTVAEIRKEASFLSDSQYEQLEKTALVLRREPIVFWQPWVVSHILGKYGVCYVNKLCKEKKIDCIAIPELSRYCITQEGVIQLAQRQRYGRHQSELPALIY